MSYFEVFAVAFLVATEDFFTGFLARSAFGDLVAAALATGGFAGAALPFLGAFLAGLAGGVFTATAGASTGAGLGLDGVWRAVLVPFFRPTGRPGRYPQAITRYNILFSLSRSIFSIFGVFIFVSNEFISHQRKLLDTILLELPNISESNLFH